MLRVSVQATSQTSKASANHKCNHLKAIHGYTHTVTSNWGIAQGFKCTTDLRFHKTVNYDEGNNQNNGNQPEILCFGHWHTHQLRLRNLDAQRTFSQPSHFVNQNLSDRTKRQGHHRQVRSDYLQRWQSQNSTKDRSHNNGGWNVDPNWEAKVEIQNTRGIGTDSKKGCVPQRDLAYITHHNIQTK